MRKRIILCLLLALLMPTVRAQLAPPSDGFTLAQCVAYARANNPNIKIARINEQISGVQVKQVIGQNLPQVGISGSVIDNYKLPVQLLPAQFFGGAPGEFVPLRFGTQYSTTLTGRVDQKLFDPTLGLALKAAKLQITLQSKVTLQAEQTQAYNVAQAYYQALVIDLQRRLITRNLGSSDTLMRQELVRLKNGTTREIDFGRIQLNRNNLQSQLEQTNRNFSQALNRLKFQMGMPIDQPLSLQALEIENELQVVELVETNANFVENRPDFQQLLINTQLANLNREANNRGYLPSFGLYTTYGTNAQRESFNFLNNGLPWFQSGAVGVTMSWNLFDGNQRRYRDQENRLNLETLRLQQILTRESAQLNLSNAQVSYQNLVSDIQRERDNITLAQRILTVTELEYKEGIATSVTLIDSKDALTTAQNNLANKLISLYQARLDYENAQGTIIDYVTKK
ncbi:outer membrane protein TolC [Spirosoma oryzae]|uniref:Outer membrane protein TolC n=1 Tax=Spirosoma oryzae TaxID=1469603 RepID=A0A2T0S772_9BACT|nr:TolC family protein [Spirosoma oryzae]PRY29264.1 outer membrane protein TolC [Spirosoma oryzae]